MWYRYSDGFAFICSVIYSYETEMSVYNQFITPIYWKQTFQFIESLQISEIHFRIINNFICVPVKYAGQQIIHIKWD